MSGNWADVWRHQVRWARTIRVSKPGGYLGLPVTFATVWALMTMALGHQDLAWILITSRMLMAIAAGWFVMRSADVLWLWFLIPIRDLFAAAIWIAGLFGRRVVWRGQVLRLSGDGRITGEPRS